MTGRECSASPASGNRGNRKGLAFWSQLEISDIGIFEKDGRRWAQLPAEPMRDASGQLLKDERGKTRYRSPLRWESRDLQERFSAALIDLVEAEHGSIGGGP